MTAGRIIGRVLLCTGGIGGNAMGKMVSSLLPAITSWIGNKQHAKSGSFQNYIIPTGYPGGTAGASLLITTIPRIYTELFPSNLHVCRRYTT